MTEYFLQNHGGAIFTELLAATHPPRKNPAVPQRKLRCLQFAARLIGAVMFGAARFGEPVLSASRGLGFYIAPRKGHSPNPLETLASASISEGFWMLRDVSPRYAA